MHPKPMTGINLCEGVLIQIQFQRPNAASTGDPLRQTWQIISQNTIRPATTNRSATTSWRIVVSHTMHPKPMTGINLCESVLIQIQFQRPNAGRRANFHVIEMTRYDRYRWAPGATETVDGRAITPAGPNSHSKRHSHVK